MNRSIFQKMVLAALVLCARLPAQIITSRCNPSELADNANPAIALAYLSRDRATLSSACLIKAIRDIGENTYKPAIPVLAKYLDFKMPPPFVPFNPLTQQPTGGLYPATDALARFGEAAVLALKAALSNEDLPSVARSNAAKALFVVAIDKTQVISLTAKTARSSGDPEAVDVLRALANVMVSHCRSDKLQRCKEALNSE